MEKRIKRSFLKQNKYTLPTLHDSKQKKSLLQSKRSHLLISTQRFKDLKKMYFQYKSNANILSNSPYYSNRQQRKEVVALINSNKYTLNLQMKDHIQNKIINQHATMKNLQSLQYATVNIKLSIMGKNVDFVVEVRSIQQMHMKLKIQYAFYEYKMTGQTKKAESIIGFQTINANTNIDFQLSLKDYPILVKSLQLKPIFSLTIKSKVKINHFHLVRCLGTGGFSLVYLVRNNWNGQFYALKLIDKEFILTSERQSIVQNERYVLGELKSQFVTRLKFCFQTKNHFAFMIQYCPGGQLFYQLKKVKKMTEEQAKFYFLQILIGLDYLHQKKILYRDLKPQNLMIAIDGHIKIADFGLAKPFLDEQRGKAYSFCGSPEYMAPQMLLKEGHNHTLDYYCLGALLYELVLGIPPFYSLNQQQIYNDILNQQITFPQHTQLSSQIKNLIRGLLEKNPAKRLGHLYGIKQILIHPWIGRINKKNIELKKLVPPFIPNLSTFNFDEEDIKDKTIQKSQKIQQDLRNISFQTHFNQDFYYQQPNTVRRQMKGKRYKVNQGKPRLQIKEQRSHFSVDIKPHKHLKRVLSQKQGLSFDN